MKDNFENSVKLLLVHEGGNDDDPHDPGGRTSRGIIQSEYNTWRKTHPGLPSDVWQAPQDTILAIYKEKYWDAMDCDNLPPGVDYCVFDYGVNSGINRAEKVFRGVATTKSRPQDIINDMCDERIAFLRGLSTWKYYGKGWSTRVAEVRRDALAMTKGAAVEPPKPVLPQDHPHVVDFGQRVKNTMLALGYPWYADQNVVSVEGVDPNGKPNANRPNAFDDVKLVLDGTGKVIGGPWEATTHPGKYWTEHPMASGGAFIIALGPQACWTPGDYHGPAWRQAEDSTIMGHRDPKMTYKRQGDPIKHGDIGVHHHHGYNLPKDNIANAAAGCQVIRLKDKQQEFYDLTTKCPRYLADKKNYRLMATVLTIEQVQKYGDGALTPPEPPKSPVTPQVTPPAEGGHGTGAPAAGAALGAGLAAMSFGAKPALVFAVFAAVFVVAALLFWLHKKGKI